MNNMKYIQIDNFNGDINIICKDDGSGEPQIFNTLKEAENTVDENCQDGQVIPLGVDVIKLLRECEEFISTVADGGFEDKELTAALDDVLGYDAEPEQQERLFTKEEVLDLIHAIDVGINPNTYEASKTLGTEDYLDLAICKASQYGLEKEFKQLRDRLKKK